MPLGPTTSVAQFWFFFGLKTAEQLKNIKHKLVGFDREVILFGILVIIIS